MLTQQSYLSVDQYTEKQKKSVSRIMETLEKGESRLGDHYQSARSYSRRTCHSAVEIRIVKEQDQLIPFTAYMGDVSPCGMSFIFPGEVVESEIIIGIPVQNQETTWFRGNIVRKRRIPGEEFWDYGVKFNGRLR